MDYSLYPLSFTTNSTPIAAFNSNVCIQLMSGLNEFFSKQLPALTNNMIPTLEFLSLMTCTLQCL